MMMMSISASGTTAMNKPLMPMNKQAAQPLGTEATNEAGLSIADLQLLSELLASSEESKSSKAGVSAERLPTPSGAMLKAQYNVIDNPICRQDGLCSACSTPEEEIA
jgi:hypothetical protein